MRSRTDLLHHVVLPNNIGVELTSKLLIFIRPIVLVVAKALGIEADHFTSIRNVIEPVAFHQGRRANALKGPIVDPAGCQLLICVLP